MTYKGSCHCGDGVDPKGNAMAAVNVNCLEGIDVGQVQVEHVDGRSF